MFRQFIGIGVFSFLLFPITAHAAKLDVCDGTLAASEVEFKKDDEY